MSDGQVRSLRFAMAGSSRSRRERLYLSDSDDEDRNASTTSGSRQQAQYDSQRVSRSSRPATRERGSYAEPSDFANLDEQAVSPPVENPDERRTYRRDPALEDKFEEGRSDPPAPGDDGGLGKPDPVRKRTGTHRRQQSLSEVAAPQPVQNTSEGGKGRREFFEDEEAGEDVSDEASPPFNRKNPEDYTEGERRAPQVPKWLTELYTISYLIFFAFLGTLARLGVQWITFYPGTPIVTPVLWANFGGSVIMGFLSEDQGLFRDRSESKKTTTGRSAEKRNGREDYIQEDEDEMAKMSKAEHSKRKKTIPLFIGLSTGFCGSFTSFSTFARDVFLALSNDLPSPIDHPHPGINDPSTTSTISRNGGYSFEAALQVVLYTLALSLGGLIAGAQIAIFLDGLLPRIHGSFTRKFVDPLFVVLGFGCWLGAIFLAIWPPHHTWRGEVVFALVFAPLGCLLRFYASLKLNGIVPAFPLGTFAVNMLGCAVEGMCYDIQHVGVGIMGRVGGGMIGCQILQGIMDGFCGTLTTVSTWVSEINGLKRKHGWGYAFGSIMGGFCLLVVIMGSVRWSVGYQDPVCDTGYTSKIHG